MERIFSPDIISNFWNLTNLKTFIALRVNRSMNSSVEKILERKCSAIFSTDGFKTLPQEEFYFLAIFHLKRSAYAVDLCKKLVNRHLAFMQWANGRDSQMHLSHLGFTMIFHMEPFLLNYKSFYKVLVAKLFEIFFDDDVPTIQKDIDAIVLTICKKSIKHRKITLAFIDQYMRVKELENLHLPQKKSERPDFKIFISYVHGLREKIFSSAVKKRVSSKRKKIRRVQCHKY